MEPNLVIILLQMDELYFLSMRVLWGSIAELEEGYQEYFHKLRNFPVFARKQKVPCTVCEDPPSLKMPCKHATYVSYLSDEVCVDRSERKTQTYEEVPKL